MTNGDANSVDGGAKRIAIDILLVGVLLFGLIFCAGVLVGFLSSSGAHGGSLRDAAIGVLLVLGAGLCAWLLVVRSLRLLRTLPKAGPSQHKVRQIWFFLIGLGTLIGVAAALIDIERGKTSASGMVRSLLGDVPIPPTAATLMLAGLLITAIVTVFYYRNIDEHDRGAQEHAALVSFNVYVVIYFGWWIAAKGGLVAPVNNAVIFIVVVSTFMVDWLWRRYR